MLKLILTCVLIASVTFTMTGCNKLKRATEASARLAAQVNALMKSVNESHRKGLISDDLALQLTDVIELQVLPSVKIYVDFIERVNKDYASTKEKPKGVIWQTGLAYFRTVETSVREFLVVFGLLTPGQSSLIQTVVEGLLDLISIIGSAFASIEKVTREDELIWAE